jgi:phenylalanyl-tRNA synthetase beta chain
MDDFTRKFRIEMDKDAEIRLILSTVYHALEDCIIRGAKKLLKDVTLFDIYTGTGIAEGKKSVAFNLTFRADDRSLTAQEADDEVKSILTLLESELGAVLR